MAANPVGYGKALRIDSRYFADSSTGTASGADFIYAWTIVDGVYEIINQTDTTVSSPMSNPNFPVYNLPTYVSVTVEGTVGLNVVNVAKDITPSAIPGQWNHSTSNTQGGLDATGNLVTLSGAEKFIPVTQTSVPGTYTLPNGLVIEAPAVFSTGKQSYQVMEGPGPWPKGIGGNTLTTMPAAMLPVWADLGGILNAQGAVGLESLTDNWAPQPRVGP